MVLALHMHHLLFPLECVCQLRYIYQFAFTTLNYAFSDESAILLADIQMGSLSQICNFHFYYFSLRFEINQCGAALTFPYNVSHIPLNHEICQIRKTTKNKNRNKNTKQTIRVKATFFGIWYGCWTFFGHKLGLKRWGLDFHFLKAHSYSIQIFYCLLILFSFD